MNEGPVRKKITAVVVCYRDAPAVPFMYQRLRAVFAKIGVDYEIIFVNDCSPDNADEVLADLAARDCKVVVIRHSRNFGAQNAFTSGMRLSTGDAVVLLDGDLQDPPEVIESFYQLWMEGYDVVYGSRLKREAAWSFQIASKVFYRLFRATSYVPVPLDAGDFSLLDRRVVDALNSLPECNRFLRGLRAWVGFKQIGVPYLRPKRMFGTTTNSVMRNVGWARKAIFSFSYIPIDLVTALAVLIVILSVVLALIQVVGHFARPEWTSGPYTRLVVLILFIGGIQLLCFSIIGSYLTHIYDEVKRRPPYIVDHILNPPKPYEADQSKIPKP